MMKLRVFSLCVVAIMSLDGFPDPVQAEVFARVQCHPDRGLLEIEKVLLDRKSAAEREDLQDIESLDQMVMGHDGRLQHVPAGSFDKTCLLGGGTFQIRLGAAPMNARVDEICGEILDMEATVSLNGQGILEGLQFRRGCGGAPSLDYEIIKIVLDESEDVLRIFVGDRTEGYKIDKRYTQEVPLSLLREEPLRDFEIYPLLPGPDGIVRYLKIKLDPVNRIAVPAVTGGDLEALQGYLDEGGDLDARGRLQYRAPTLLYLAAEKGQAEVVQFLMTQGADPRLGRQPVRGWLDTPLGAAIFWGHEKTLRILLAHGREAYTKQNFDEALDYSVVNRDEAIVRMLVPRVDRIRGRTVFRAAGACRDGGRVVEVLLEAGAFLHARNGQGRTLLMQAVSNGQIDCVGRLIRRGARINAISDARPAQTALDMARESGDQEIIRVLEKSGARVFGELLAAEPGMD